MTATLAHGAYHRVRVAMPPAYERDLRARLPSAEAQRALLDDLAARLSALGWRDVVPIQDPTAPGVFTATAVWSGPSGTFRAPFVAEIVEPPAPAPQSAVPPQLDQGTTEEEAWQLRAALVYDDNPRHLRGVATSFEPGLPLAASLLRIKADLLEGRARARVLRRQIEGRQRDAVLRAALSRRGIDGARWLDAARVPERTRAELENLSRGLGTEVARTWRRLAPSGGAWLPDARAAAAIAGSADPTEAGRLAVGPSLLSDLWFACVGTNATERARDLAAAGGTYRGLLERRRAALLAYAKRKGLPPALAEDHARLVASRLGEAGTIADTVPPEVAQAARAIVREIGPGLRVVDADAVRVLCPPSDRDGYISPGALQLALATMKPRWSRVQNDREATRLCDQLSRATAGDLDAVRANAELHKGVRGIERQRWIDWRSRLHSRCPPQNRSSRVASFGR